MQILEVTPEDKEKKLEYYLKLKQETNKDILDCLIRGDISQDVYCKFIESGERGFIEFLNLLNANHNKGQTEIDFNTNQL